MMEQLQHSVRGTTESKLVQVCQILTTQVDYQLVLQIMIIGLRCLIHIVSQILMIKTQIYGGRIKILKVLVMLELHVILLKIVPVLYIENQMLNIY